MSYGEQKKGRQKVGWQEELEKGRVEARRREEGRPEVLAQVVAEEGRAEVALTSGCWYNKEAGTSAGFFVAHRSGSSVGQRE